MHASPAELAAAVLRQYPSGPAAPAGLAAHVEPVVALLGAVLIAFTLAAMPLVMRVFAWITGADASGGATRRPGWGFVQIAAVVAWIVFFSLAMHFVAPGERGEIALIGILVRSALLLGTSGLLILAVAIVRDPRGVAALGLSHGRTLRSAIAAWLAYVASVPGLIGLALLSRWLLDRLGVETGMQVVVSKFLDLDASDVPAAIVLGVAVMPFFEELAFRGFVQPVLVQRLGARWGVGATSIVFGGLHGPGAFLPIFGLSMVLGVVMLRTERLLACWAVHALHNGIVFAVLVYFRSHPEFAPHGAWLAFS